jgi:hypothetical protein
VNASQRTHAEWLRSGARLSLCGLLLCAAVAWIVRGERHPQGAASLGPTSFRRPFMSQHRAPATRAAASGLVVPAKDTGSDTLSASKSDHASLATEVALLQRAVQAIAQRDPSGALRAIHEHRARIEHPSLSEERDGLLVLAHCLAADAGAARRAALYVSKHPHAVLVPRIERSCGRLEVRPNSAGIYFERRPR